MLAILLGATKTTVSGSMSCSSSSYSACLTLKEVIEEKINKEVQVSLMLRSLHMGVSVCACERV